MAGRTRPRWAVMVGGPRDGKRHLLTPDEVHRFREYTLIAPGVAVAHDYELTDERISAKEWQERQIAAGNPWAMVEHGGRVARCVGAAVVGTDMLPSARARQHGTPKFEATQPSSLAREER